MCEHAGQPVTGPTDFMGAMVVAECGWREFGGFRETRGDAGQPITDFTDFADFTDYTKFGSRAFGKKCEIGKIRKLSIVSYSCDGAGSAQRESGVNCGVGNTNKIRDGPPAILTIFADFAEFARPTSGNNRESRNVGDGLSSVPTLFTLCATYGRPQFGRNRGARESAGRSITDVADLAVFPQFGSRAFGGKCEKRERV